MCSKVEFDVCKFIHGEVPEISIPSPIRGIGNPRGAEGVTVKSLTFERLLLLGSPYFRKFMVVV